MNAEDRPLLRAQEQIEHLKTKGVVFDLSSEADAASYLSNNNNYFKLRAFRKGFSKKAFGSDAGMYAHLDFEYLKDLSIIDMRLRYCMLPVALDIEHSAKVKLLERLDKAGDNGYTALEELLENDKSFKNRVGRDLATREKDPYCCDLIEKYREGFPAWVYSEVVSFGNFLTFYKYVGEKTKDRDMIDDFFLLLSVKRLRNACAHSNCILNDLSARDGFPNVNYGLRDDMRDAGVSKNTREKKMSNPRIFDLITTLYSHNKIVSSEGRRHQVSQDMQKMKSRMFHHISYYEFNHTIISTFNFFGKMIDYWYPCDIVTP